ncbi:MAG: hypothetical protein KAX65_01750 [Caldilineaceae bacterium]|nr:hypothetical protein [Caldilineaceae bacterium]
MTLTEQYNLASNSDFIKRVTMAMINAAIAISNEGAGAANHALRARHAARVLNEPGNFAPGFALGVASNPVVTAESTDSDIQFTVNSNWDAFAGTSAL